MIMQITTLYNPVPAGNIMRGNIIGQKVCSAGYIHPLNEILVIC